MEVENLIGKVKDVVTVKQVFGQPYEKDGITVIPVASVSGGVGGGQQKDMSEAESNGAGGGMGFSAKPAGVYVIKDGKVSWQPAVNVNRVIAGGQLVAGVAMTGLMRKKFKHHRRFR